MNIKQLALTLTLAVTPVIVQAQNYYNPYNANIYVIQQRPMLDTSIYKNIRTVDAAKIYEDGQRIADMQLKNSIEREYVKLFRQTDGDLYKMRELSLKLKVSPWLTPKIDEKIRQKELQELELLQRKAEIARLESTIRQNNAEAQAIREKTAQKELQYKQPQQPTQRFLTDDEIRQVLPHIDHPANKQQNTLPELPQYQKIDLN
ncbi:hypothetical protein [Moraxella sp. ZY210820]|uniref:hypothetical protein n=1 Tax=Moraxella sp. ZY210820 TaxID=2904123 RepID=UPI00273006AB|nr:hypothetical protein [Moraxella sp. ZY210820]WLF84808.1 hypothetical protein LU301_04925 [Moraxella sp. ZY210820]